MSGLFHVYHDGRYWVAVILEESEERSKIGKFIFGTEPTPAEIFEWARKGCPGLLMTETHSISNKESIPKLNPKRLQRESRRAQENRRFGTYSQEKLHEALAERKLLAKASRRETKLLRAQERYEKKLIKKKKKKKGH